MIIELPLLEEIKISYVGLLLSLLKGKRMWVGVFVCASQISLIEDFRSSSSKKAASHRVVKFNRKEKWRQKEGWEAETVLEF